MKLQSDPTIIYGLVGGKGTLGRPIKRSEITQPSPYNTYVIDGLPPGPIANPGRASLEAAANPARTRDLFFVADGTGGHAFTETYDQHQKNVAKLRAMEKQIQNDTVEPAAEDAPAGRGRRCARRYQSDRDHDDRPARAEEAAPTPPARRPGSGPAGRGAIDHDATGARVETCPFSFSSSETETTFTRSGPENTPAQSRSRPSPHIPPAQQSAKARPARSLQESPEDPKQS